MAKATPRRKSPRPPRGLVVDRIECDGEELLVFTWEQQTVPPPALTAAEREVLARVARGESNATIARARKTSVRTVANQVASLLRKTGAGSRFELIRRYAGGRGG